MRAISYAAVSTDEQAAEGRNSIPQQLADNAATAEARGWQIVETVVIDGHSRSYEYLHDLMADCPAYAQFVRLIQQHAADVVLCRDWDRVGRTAYLVQEVSHLAIRSGVQFLVRATPETIYEPDEYRALSDPQTTHLLRSFHGYSAEQDIMRLKARYRAGMIGRVRRGLSLGPASVPYGYRYAGRDLPYVPDPVESPWLLWMFARRAEGWSYRAISDGLNEQGAPCRRAARWRHQSVRQIVSNEFYAGLVRFRDTAAPGAHQRLISDDLWQRARLVSHNRATPRYGVIHPLSGLTRCALCGWGLGPLYATNGHTYLRCNRYGSGHGCQSFYMRIEQAEAAVLAQVRAVLADPVEYAETLRQRAESDGHAERLAALHRQLSEVDAQAKRATTAYIMGHLPEDDLVAQSERIKRQRVSILEGIGALQQTAQRAATMLANLTGLAELVAELEQLAPVELNAVYRRLIARVEFAPHAEPRIVWAWDDDA